MNDKTTNDLSSPSNQIPASTRVQIDKLCQNPVVEQKRRIRHLEVMRGNTNALKNGKYSKLHPTPDYLLGYLDYIDELQFDQTREIIEIMARLIKSNLKRISLKEYLELSDGEIGGKQLSKMLRDTFVMAQSIGHFMAIHKSEMNNQTFDMRDAQNLTYEERNTALIVIRTALQKLREGKNSSVEALPS